MSSLIDISNEKLFRRRLTSLDTSTKISNSNNSNGSIRARGSQLIQNYSKIILPSINSNINRNKRKTIIEPESLMSKFLGNYKPNYSDKIPKETKIKLSKLKNVNSRNSIMILKSKSLNNIEINTRKEAKYKSQRILMTEKDKNKFNLLSNMIKNNKSNLLDKIKENILEEKKLDFENNKGEQITNIKSISENDNNEDSLINEKELYIINNNIDKDKNQYQQINTNSSSIITKNVNNIKNDKNIKNLSLITNSTSHNSSLISNNFNTNYKRLRKFLNPLLKENLKEQINLNTSQKNININKEQNLLSRLYENNISFQAKILEEQIRLLNGCYKEYKLIFSDMNFIEVFKSKTLFSKIKYNKIIEETCSILYYLPKFILKDWYDLLLNLEKIKIPSSKKFISDYITDENITVKSNNYLLIEVINYFNKTSEFFLMLSKKENEAADVKFSQKNFFVVIKNIKTARYNIIYLINSFNNSKKKFVEDLTIIKKFLIRNNNINTNKNLETKNENNFSQKIFNNIILLENERNKNIDAIEKIEEQFYFKRDDEAQKKRQIESALDIDKRKPIYDHLGNMVIKKRKLYKSIFLNKYMNKVLNYCYDNVRDQIITEKVNDQEENAENIGKSLNPIKFNFN